MTNTNQLNDTLTSLFIEEQSGALEARLFDYERDKQNNGKTKIALERLRLDLEEKQKEIIKYAIDFDSDINLLGINQDYKLQSIKIAPENRHLINGLIKQLIPFMIKEDINRFNKLDSTFQIVLTIYRNKENGPIIIKKVELIDLDKINTEDNSKKGGNIYQINIG